MGGSCGICRQKHIVEGSSILILRTGENGTVVSLKTTFIGVHTPTGEQWAGGQALGTGLCCCSWAGSEAVPWQQGWLPGTLSPAPLSLCLHLPSHHLQWMFATLVNTRASPHEHSCNTVIHHLHIICSSVAPVFPQWSWQSQLLYWGFLKTNYNKKELHKRYIFVFKAWKQRISKSQSCLGRRELN